MAIPKSEIQHWPSAFTRTEVEEMSLWTTDAICSVPRTSVCRNIIPEFYEKCRKFEVTLDKRSNKFDRLITRNLAPGKKLL